MIVATYNISRKNIGDVVLVDVIQGLTEGKCLDLRTKTFQLMNKYKNHRGLATYQE